jgi:hypothetical protein
VKDVEIAVLRHQVMVLRRQIRRPRFTPSDRMVLAMLAQLLPARAVAGLPGRRGTLLRRHRRLVGHRWNYPPTGPPPTVWTRRGRARLSRSSWNFGGGPVVIRRR